MAGESNLYYWFDGGMRFKQEDNTHVFHVSTRKYRADFDVFRGSFKGFELGNEKYGQELFGLYENECVLPLTFHIKIDTDAGVFSTGKIINPGTQAYVMDNGPLVHRTKVDNLLFVNSRGGRLENIYGHFEIVFYSDRIYIISNLEIEDDVSMKEISLEFCSCNNFRIVTTSYGEASECHCAWGYLSQTGNQHLGLMPSVPTALSHIRETMNGSIEFVYDKEKICITGMGQNGKRAYSAAFQLFPIEGDASENGWRLYNQEMANCSKTLQLEAGTIEGVEVFSEGYDPLRGFFVFKMVNNDEKFQYRKFQDELERYRYWLLGNEYGFNRKIRILWKREGTPGTGALALDGIWRPWGSHVVHRDENGIPTGLKLQISKDFHEFNEFPKPYSHCWLHIYMEQELKDLTRSNEIAIAYGEFYGKLAAQFSQLSLMGWDDNSKYQPPETDIYGQIWHQGICGESEVFCISPESIHTDNFYTDWRPLRTGKKELYRWASNFGGGDILRYENDGYQQRVRLVAPRIDYRSNGPIVGKMVYHLSSEDNVFVGTLEHSILAGDDYVRIYISAKYTVLKDASLRELSIFSFGAENYNPSIMNNIASGKYDDILQHRIIPPETIQNIGFESAVSKGYWFAQHGYENREQDETKNDPRFEAARGIIIRGMEVNIKRHPDLYIKAVPVMQHISYFEDPVNTVRMELLASEDEIQVCKGDRISMDAEIIVYSAYRESYDGSNQYYLDLIENHRDSKFVFKPVIMEAVHGNFKIDVFKGTLESGEILPVVRADKHGEAEFSFKGGIGFYPFCIKSKSYHGKIKVLVYDQDGWREEQLSTQSGGKYQVDYDASAGDYYITFGLDILPCEFNKREMKVKVHVE